MKLILSTPVAAIILASIMFACSSGAVKKAKSKTEADTIKTELSLKKELVTFQSEDELTITADLYTLERGDGNPFIILFHQAGFSRGEYVETAYKFLELGYNCLAIDQRSGGEVNGVINETHKAAVAKSLPTEYTDAMPDLMAAIEYVKDKFEPESLYILGSSYSATLALIIAAQNPDMVTAVMAFSPGEYFEYEGTSLEEYTSEILVPVFITSARSERKKWKPVYEAIQDENKQKFIPEFEGVHGSRALWETTAGHKEYWKAVKKFLAVN